MTRRNPPKLPVGKLIKCEGVVLTSSGRVKKMKIRDAELKKLTRSTNPFSEKPELRVAIRRAKAELADYRKRASKRPRGGSGPDYLDTSIIAAKLEQIRELERRLRRVNPKKRKRNPSARTLTGRAALQFAGRHRLNVSVYGMKTKVSPQRARKIAREDPGLLYLTVTAKQLKKYEGKDRDTPWYQ